MPSFADVEEQKEQRFSVSSDSKFSIDNINGSIEITRWQQDEIKVIAHKSADDQDDLERMKVSMKQSGNRVHVETKYEKQNQRHNQSGSVDYEVWLPANMSTTDVDLVNGSLTIEKIDGDIEADLVNGSIRVIGASGNSKLQSVNGSVKLEYSEVLSTVERIDVETVNGSIKVYFPADVSASVEAETMHGGLSSDFGLSVDKQFFSGKNMSGIIGSGTVKVTLESVNGGIKVIEN